MTYKIYHSKGTPYVITETDLPSPDHFPMEMFKGREQYKAALEAALSTKGIEVANAEYVGSGFDSGGPYVIYSFNNKQCRLRLEKLLCDLSEGFSCEFEWQAFDSGEWRGYSEQVAKRFHPDKVRRVATILPIEKKEYSQDELWSDVEDIVYDSMVKYYGVHSEYVSGQLAYNIKENIKSRYQITRRA